MPSKKNSAPNEEVIAAYLREHPDFLVRHHDILDQMLPPERELGDGISDFQRFLVDKLKGQIELLRENQQALIAAGRDNESTLSRIHGAALRLCEAHSLEQLAAIISDELPALCEISAAALAVESADLALPATAGRIVPGTLERWLGPADILLQSHTPGHPELFGAKADSIRSIAMLRLEPGEGQPTCVIAFGSEDPEWFTPDQGTDLISFLAGIVSRCLGHLLP